MNSTDADSPSSAHPSTTSQWSPPPTLAQQLTAGRALRRQIPLRELGTLTARARDPLGILERQNEGRLQELIPIRRERMSQNPFAFYRGTAAIMADDFASEPHTDLLIPSCGDAHIANFGFYASPQRTLVFDLNDFDEAAWAPWEWDLKRMVASVVIGGQAGHRSEEVLRRAVLGSVRAYAVALRSAVAASPRDRYYAHIDADAGVQTLPPQTRQVLEEALSHARKRTGERAVRKLTVLDEHGRRRFIEDPPTTYRLPAELERRVYRHMHRYLETVSSDIRLLLQHYVMSDAVRRVVGVGSVGTRCALSLLQDGNGNAMIMQSKQAGRSVLEEYGKIPQPRALETLIAEHGNGARVVSLQRVLQALSDPFLGYLRLDDIDLYVRQFHDMKGGIEAETLEDEPFETYAQACAVTLARAHAQAPVAAMISGYLGGGRKLGAVLLDWAYRYAELSAADFALFASADAENH